MREQQGHKELYKMGFDGAAIEKFRHLTPKQLVQLLDILQKEFHNNNITQKEINNVIIKS